MRLSRRKTIDYQKQNKREFLGTGENVLQFTSRLIENNGTGKDYK